MKGLFSIVFSLIAFTHLFAEYGGEYHTVEIRLKNGTIDTGYFYVADAYFDRDSIEFSEYLIERLVRSYNYESDSIRYYEHLINYDYHSVQGDYNGTEYSLISPVIIDRDAVEEVQIIQSIRSSYLQNIGSSHAIEDTLWMQQPPQSSFSISGNLCYWQVFVHKESESVESLKKEIEQAAKAMNTRLRELEQEVEDYPSRENEARLNEFEYNMDQQLSELINKFEGKVVIIAECTC